MSDDSTTSQEQNMECEGFPSSLLNVENQVKLSLKVNDANKDNIKQFTELLVKNSRKPNIKSLDLSGNDLTSAGTEIGHLLSRLPDTEVLNLFRCSITAETLKDMADVIRKENVKLNMKQLLLRESEIAGAGEYLADLLKQMKLLETLDISYTELSEEDLVKLSADETKCNIKNLCINTDSMQTHKLKDVFNMSPSLEVLVVSVLSGEEYLWMDIKECLTSPNSSSLKVLSVEGFHFPSGTLRQLPDHLPPSLQALGVSGSGKSHMEDLLYLLTKLPPTLTHLNVSGNRYQGGMKEIAQMKQHLSHLKKLNIGHFLDADNEANLEELKQGLPDLQVYYQDEDMWQMYK